MQLTNLFTLLTTLVALSSATAVVDPNSPGLDLITRQNCGGNLGRCDQNGCEGRFNSDADLFGTCTEGTFEGCPCSRCGKTDKCTSNGCEGVNRKCTAGQFVGCICN